MACAPGAWAAGGALSGSPVDRVVFTDGREVAAPIIKETGEAVWLDLGYDVVRVPRTSVERIERAERSEGEGVVEAPGAGRLYRVATGIRRSGVRRSSRSVWARGGADQHAALWSSGFLINDEEARSRTRT